MSEDLSEGEKGDVPSDVSMHNDSIGEKVPRVGSVDTMESWASQHKDKKLYIVLIRHESKPPFFPFALNLSGNRVGSKRM